MSFIKTIFPATKRRKTDANTFVQPQPPVPRNGQQERAASTTLPSTPKEQPTPTVTRSPIFDSFCTMSERELRPDMLRMVLIEAEQRVLFDTASIVPIGNRVLPPNAQLSACKKFQFLKRRRDISTISQMLFGAMPTAMGSDSFKIHTIPEDQRLLVSRVFGIPRISSREMRVAADSLESSDSESQSHYITVRSMDSMNGAHGKAGCISSTAPPEAFKRIRNASLQLDDESEEARPFSPPTASRLSRDRRIQMSHKTSLCEQFNTPFEAKIPESNELGEARRMSAICWVQTLVLCLSFRRHVLFGELKRSVYVSSVHLPIVSVISVTEFSAIMARFPEMLRWNCGN
ncbi:hypothetical protein ANCCAN_01432 [Ancylostoma caninum]|uniref:Uncharacterized protein n=1 Tax=Ancylostoma caninum TaxID=29170 RepID=A0A368HAK1_ANCCA|nr:hypothetical protein ANCCAN_01432 [Ancylostoma caninum]